MKRYHLFEFGDLDGFPQMFKDMETDYLNFVIDLFKLHDPVIPLLKEGLEKSGTNQMLDLCSGAGGGMLKMSQELQKAYPQNFTITLTDKYPNLDALHKVAANSDGRIDFMETPVDAHAVPENLTGFRTIFNAFHHFPPAYARQVLADAVKQKRAIAIFEALERKWANVVPPIFLIPIFVLVLTPFIKPFKLSRLLFTYLIPIMPLIITWDGIVSALRSYTPEELEKMAGEVENENYTWKAGKLKGDGPNALTYLTGSPV